MDLDGDFDEPIAEIKIKPWHILALLGIGGIAAYFLLRKKDEPEQAPPPSPKTGASGLSEFAALGEQTEPLYDGNPLVDKARVFAQKGWTVFKIPTGQENVMQNRERFPVHIIYAAPPGRPIPAKAIRVQIKP